MLDIATVVSKFPEEIRTRYDFSGAVYAGSLVRMRSIQCPVHGEFTQYPSVLRKGMGCPKCGAVRRADAKRTPAEDYFVKVAEIHGGKYDYSVSKFTIMNARLDVRCPVHGVFSISANHHYYRKQGCGKCETEAKRTRIVRYRHLSHQSKIDNTAKTFFDKCREVHEDRYTYPEQEYRGAKEKIRVVCPVHGEFQQAAWDHLAGGGCATCGTADPKWERDLAAYIEGFGLRVERSAPVLGGKHIDIYVPERKFGVELHGLKWHTTQYRAVDYHRTKWEAAEAEGIQLLQVFEDEWVNRLDVVRARIAAMLGFGEKFAARKCSLSLLEPSEARTFLDATHIQGAGNASMYYGLRFDARLIAVASFGKSRTGAMTGAMEEGVWEVIRYASVGRVRGGFGKLFSAFLKDVQPERVVSYCDLRYGNGALYKATGFTLDSVTPPDYWWVPNGKVVRVPRYTTQKHKLKDHPVLGKFYSPGKTEAQICAEAGWHRIYGVGHQRWVWLASIPQAW